MTEKVFFQNQFFLSDYSGIHVWYVYVCIHVCTYNIHVYMFIYIYIYIYSIYIYIYTYIYEGLFEVTVESWPEGDLNPRPLDSV